MFEAAIYANRRQKLMSDVESGVILLMGNPESPMNYLANTYHFRQDSSFLYFVGINLPDLAAIIDVDEGRTILFGEDLTVDQIVWMGPQPTLSELGAASSISEIAPAKDLASYLGKAKTAGRQIHYLPPYRGENIISLFNMLDIPPSRAVASASEKLIRAVIAQRAYKSEEEIQQIEIALDTSHAMHVAAMQASASGKYEREVVALKESVAYARGVRVAYPVIFSVDGQTLHNHYHGNVMQDGDIIVNDSGAESPMYYASDITRTIPVSGRFTDRQRELYEIVLDSEVRGIEAIKPGVRFLDIHKLCARILMEGLKDVGLVKGDPQEIVETGAYACFFQCGTGHMMGLDVHDMEDLGEQFVGYDSATTRSDKFGMCYLRMARALESGFVVTVEPGLYFIPELIDQWRREKKFEEFINYDKLERYRDFGGIRIEDNVLVTDDGFRILGKPIPKTVADVEAACAM